MSEQPGARLNVAVVTTIVVGVTALAAVGVGMNLYLDDYCATAMDLPAEAQNWSTTSARRFADPVTIECRYDNVGWVQQTDRRPLIYATGMFGLVLGVVMLLGVWIHRAGLRQRAATHGPAEPNRR